MNSDRSTDKISVPVHEETVSVERQTVPRATVRIETVVTEHREPVEAELLREAAEIERVPIGRIVSERPPVRDEGGVLVIPLVEEVLVVERRLRLREEVRVRKKTSAVAHSEEAVLRSEEAVISRQAPETNDANQRGK
jgi:stress response protein YsnF